MKLLSDPEREIRFADGFGDQRERESQAQLVCCRSESWKEESGSDLVQIGRVGLTEEGRSYVSLPGGRRFCRVELKFTTPTIHQLDPNEFGLGFVLEE